MKSLKEFRPLLKLVKEDLNKLIFASIIIFMSGICEVFTGYLNGKVVEEITMLDIKNALIFLGIYFVLEITMDGVVLHYANSILYKEESKLTRKLGFYTYKKALCLPPVAYEKMSSGEIMNRITSDADTLSFAFGRLLNMISSLVASIIVIVYVFINSWIIGLEIVGIVSILFLILKKYNPLLKDIHKERRKEQDKFTSLTTESIRGIREIKTLGIKNNLISDMLEYKLHLVTNPLFIIIPVIFMIIVIGVSAFIPSRRASKVSPIEAIRQNDDIKINKKKIRTSKLVLKLFGIEGEIALKNIKRNKKKYRVTIVSLFISIVLFISFSSYMNYTLNTASSVMGEVPYDYQISYFGDDPNNDKEALDKINEIVKSSDVKEYVSYSVSNLSIIGNYTYSDEYLDFYKSAYGDDGIKALNNLKYQSIYILVLDDNSYNKYKKLVGLDKDSVILLNRFKGVSYGNNKRVNYDIPVINNGNINIKICNFDDDDDVDTTKYCNKNIDNIFVTNKSFDLIEEFSYMDDFKLIVNKKLYDSISDSSTHYTQFNIISDNTNNIDKLTKELDKYSNVNYTNIKEAMKQANNLILVVKILMYGFISLVTLIGVTSVFNTISTSMALRKREFAVLRSIGLTNRGFNKILFFESLFFGMKSLIFAIPVSIGITVLIHYALADMVSISTIIIPWKYIIISIVSVFVIVLLTMMYSTSKIKKHNIIEQIREENI